MNTRPSTPQILALGGGGFSMEKDSSLLDDYVLSLTGAERPRVCFLPTASGDADHYVVRFYRRFSPDCEASHVSLFRRDQGTGGIENDLEGHLLEQDLIYVGGGSVVSLLGTWRAHGIDEALREAWQAGVVLCGGSAGSLCWFTHAVSGFHEGPARQIDGLGFLPWSNAVHYEEEPGRRTAFEQDVAEGIRPGYGPGAGAGLRFICTEHEEVVSPRPQAKALYVSSDGDGGTIERE